MEVKVVTRIGDHCGSSRPPRVMARAPARPVCQALARQAGVGQPTAYPPVLMTSLRRPPSA
jgi:hypothetical protein